MRGGILLATFLFVVLSLSLAGSSPEVLPQNISSQGSNWETTCEAGNCQTTLYSYEKYFLRNNKWEEIDENWHDCSSGGITTFCTQTYHFSVRADNQGNVVASRDGQQYAMRMNGVTGSSIIFNPVIDGSVLTYQDVVPGFVDVQYQYLPQKLKESIILKTPLRNLSEGDFNISFSRSGEGRFAFERPYICDAQLKCEYLNLFEEGETVKIQVPIKFLNSPRTVYPLVIDPTITLNNSFIAWNGHVSNTTIQADPPTQDYKRYDNPVTISLSNLSRGDIDWNVSSIPDNSIIKNATLAFVVSASSFPFNVSVMPMEKPSFGYPNVSSDCPNGNCQFYSDMGNGTEYNRSLVTTNSVLRNYTLSSQALTDLHNSLTSDIFSTGLVTDYNGTATLGSSTSSKSSNRPVLIITHTYESYNLTYDTNGNLIQGFNKYLEYDGGHRVSRVRQNNASGRIIEEYVYDHEGNRLKKVEYNIDSNNTNRTTYYLDDEFINVRITNGTQYNETYYYANDKLIAMKEGTGNKLYYHPDHLGSTTLVTNQSGDVVEDDVYLPYGDIYSGAADTRYLFTGKERDASTGFDYFGARYYSSQFMHFLQPDDPAYTDVYNPQDLNHYTYVRNNPYTYTDPSGHFVDTALDVGFIAYDIYTIVREPHNSANYLALGADAGAVILPGITGLGIAVRTAKAGEKALDAVTTADKLADGVQGIKALNDGKDIAKTSQLTAQEVGKLQNYEKTLKQTGEVTVENFNEANTLRQMSFSDLQKVKGAGQNTPKVSQGLSKEAGTYNMDYKFDPATGRIYGHSSVNRHAYNPHINIRDKLGNKYTILINKFKNPFKK